MINEDFYSRWSSYLKHQNEIMQKVTPEDIKNFEKRFTEVKGIYFDRIKNKQFNPYSVHDKTQDPYDRWINYILCSGFLEQNNLDDLTERQFKHNMEQIPPELRNNPYAIVESVQMTIRHREFLFLLHNRIFKFSDDNQLDLLKLLTETDTKIEYKKMPFNHVQISFLWEDIIKGVDIFNIGLQWVTCDGKTDDIHYLITGVDNRDETEVWMDGRITEKVGDRFDIYTKRHLSLEEDIEIRKKMRLFICNFLEYLNHPCCKISIFKQDNSEARIRRGKFPIPDKIVIDVGGSLFNYIKLNKEKGYVDYSHKFWVRGHYINYRNKVFYKRLYSLEKNSLEKQGYFIRTDGLIASWILPYIKGKGELINKSYEIK